MSDTNKPSEAPSAHVNSPPAGSSTQPISPSIPNQIVIKSSGASRFVSWLGWLGLLLCIPIILGMAAAYRDYFDNSHGLQERFHSLSRTAKDKVAIIRVSGTIMDGSGFVKHQIDRVRDDENVKGIVLRVDSPGGSVSGSDYILHHLIQLREEKKVPLVVSMGGLAASGGYYVSMAVGDQQRSIFAEPTTTTGSIGVIIPHYDLSGLLSEIGVKDDSFVSHPRKQILSMTRPAAEEDRQVIQDYLQQAFERFKTVIKEGRPALRENPQQLDDVATGEIFSAPRAVELGLVDEIGFIEDAISRVIEMAELDEQQVRVVQYRQPNQWLGSLGLARSSEVSLPQTLLDLSVPRAHYMFTTIAGFPGDDSNRNSP